jgi:hypothetical protein
LFPYWLLFSAFALGSLQYQRRISAGAEQNPLLLIAGLVTAVMIGLRFEVGGDWGNYITIFERIRYLDLGGALRDGDPGYTILNWLAHQLGYGIWFVNLICGAIFTWGLVRFARQQPNPWLAILVAIPYLIIVVAMGYTRQAVAIGIVMAGLAALQRTTVLRFAIYVLVAVAFHKSAIIVLPIVALSAARNRIVVAGLLLLLMATLYYVFVASQFDDLVTNYIDAEYQSEGAAVRVAMNLPPAIIYLLYKRQFDLSPDQQKLWANFSYAALFTLVALLVVASSTAVDRLALYLIPLQVFVLGRLPEVFRGAGRKNSQLLLMVIGYSAIIQFVWLNYANNAAYWLPYQFYPAAEQTGF